MQKHRIARTIAIYGAELRKPELTRIQRRTISWAIDALKRAYHAQNDWSAAMWVDTARYHVVMGAIAQELA